MKKVYLDTPEAVIKALKEGKEVRDENDYSFKIVDGFIVSTAKNEFFVGDSIYSDYKPYILEEEPLKIEVGKFYKTRDGKKVICMYKDNISCSVSLIGSLNGYYWVTENGKCIDTTKEYPADIIGLWKEDK